MLIYKEELFKNRKELTEKYNLSGCKYRAKFKSGEIKYIDQNIINHTGTQTYENRTIPNVTL